MVIGNWFSASVLHTQLCNCTIQHHVIENAFIFHEIITQTYHFEIAIFFIFQMKSSNMTKDKSKRRRTTKMLLLGLTSILTQFALLLLSEVGGTHHKSGGDQYLMRPRPAKGFLTVTKLQVNNQNFLQGFKETFLQVSYIWNF